METVTATKIEQQQPSAAATPASAVPVRELRPRVDIYENKDEVLLVAEVPGASAESVSVRLEDDVLSLTAERTTAAGYKIQYKRAFQVPDSIDPDAVSAELKHGVLNIHLAKAAKAKPRQIPVQAY